MTTCTRRQGSTRGCDTDEHRAREGGRAGGNARVRLATLGSQPGAAIAGVDPMLDKLTADARRLQPSAPNDQARAALEDLLRDLVAIRSAVSAIETTGAAAETVDLPGRLASMRASLDRVLATR